MIGFPKPVTHRNPKWLRAVASIEACVLCGKHGCQAAHRNQGKGMGIKADDCLTAALCPDCHREIDQGKGLTKAERHARMDEAIVLTLRELVLRGAVALAP